MHLHHRGSGFYQNLHDEGTANQDCQVMEQLGASLNKTISIHNINEPEYELIVIKREREISPHLTNIAQRRAWRDTDLMRYIASQCLKIQ